MTSPHYLTLSVNAAGNRVTDWSCPGDCPSANSRDCDVFRRALRMGDDLMALGNGREPGQYLVSAVGADALVLVDDQGRLLPEVPWTPPVPYNDSDPTPPDADPLAVAAYEVILMTLNEIAEFVVEDSEMALGLFGEIRAAQITGNEYRAVRPCNILINDGLGRPAAYAEPITRLLEQLGVPVPTAGASSGATGLG